DKIQKAINLYREANSIKSDETYPAEEVAKLQEKLDRMNDGAAAYNKLIAVADKKFDGEDFKKAKELYSRAKDIKPADTYPPAQIRKINKILKDKGDKDAQISSFQEIIKRADASLGSESYQKALSEYNEALGVIPGSAYPTKQIEKIKGILNALADTKAEATLAEKATEVFNASEFYGEDITGKYSDTDLDKVFEDEKVSHTQWRDVELEKTKTADIEMKEELSLNSQNLSDENFQMYEKYKQKLSDDEVIRDAPRQDIVEQVEAFVDRAEDKSATDQQRFTDRTIETYEEARKFEESTAIDTDTKVRNQESNAAEYEKYKDKLINWKEQEEEVAFTRTEAEYADKEDYRTNATKEQETSIERRDRTAEQNAKDNVTVSEWNQNLQGTDDVRDYKQFEAIEQYKEDVALFSKDSDERRENFVDEMEKYKDQDRELQKTQGIKNSDRTYETHAQIEDDYTQLALVEQGFDQPRLEHANEYEDYKDQLADATANDGTKNADNVYDQHLATENYKTRVTNEFTNSDVQRQKNVDAVEMTSDKLAGQKLDKNASGEKRTYEQHLAQEEFATKNSELLSDSDTQRQKNVDAVERTTDDLESQQLDKNRSGEKRTYEQHLAQEDFATKTSNLFTDADIPRQKTVDEVTKYQDKQYDDKANKNAQLDDVYDARRKTVEANDNISDRQFSEDLSNELALKYGPGIHEKVYQRKDKRGNIMQVTIIRVVVIDGKGYEYKRVKSRFAEQYFKDGRPITETIWDTETSRASE
ncbi:MAG: hypothetical protein JKY54_17445, partial [Flavobacteriales bacterium]|nr:hypothetical protein [Flavobacteriales bacterium]